VQYDMLYVIRRHMKGKKMTRLCILETDDTLDMNLDLQTTLLIYRVATISRYLKMLGLFGRISSVL